jgi:hypothetical protein
VKVATIEGKLMTSCDLVKSQLNFMEVPIIQQKIVCQVLET